LQGFPRPFQRQLLTLVLGLVVLARVRVGADDLAYARFGDYLESLRVQTGVPGLTAAIMGRSDIQWERAFGYQDVDRSVAARTDTPMHVDGITESIAATLALRCVEEGRLSLDSKVTQSRSENPDTAPTLRQLLTHTVGSSPSNPVFNYRPDLLAPLSGLIRACTGDSFRETLANRMDQLAMAASVPGMDVITLVPPAEGILTPAVDRYRRILDRMALPYAVDSKLKATLTSYSSTTLTATAGLVTTVRDYAQFDLALRNGVLLKADTLASAWRPVSGNVPHGIGWFVQSYNGENVVWNYGTGENGSSSMVIVLPGRSLSLVMMANSNGLAKGFYLNAGDVTTSPFARLFLSLFAYALR